MHILYVINSVEGGGAALPVPSILDVLTGGGARVTVLALTRRDGRAIAAIEATGVPLIVRDGGEKDHRAAFAWLDRQVKALNPTHIWTSLTRATLLGQLVGLRRRIPVVSWQHAATLKSWNRRLLRLQQPLARLWVGDSTSVTQLTHDRLGVPWERLVCWPIFRADPDAPQALPWQLGDPVRIGSLGRLHPVKGYDVLIDALALVGEGPFIVEVRGEGAEREALEARAAAAGVTTLRFAGYANHPRDWLATQHLYVQPSRSEGLCVAVHEAMQAGLPVIASAVGELPHSILDGVTGWTVPPGDAVALANALRTALMRPERLQAMGAEGRARLFSLFSPERFQDAGEAIIERMKVMR
jgi:glycosyltransferase involved in cell wall biosynthesis